MVRHVDQLVVEDWPSSMPTTSVVVDRQEQLLADDTG